MDTDMERTQVYLPKGLKKELSLLAAREDSNLSALLRQAGEDMVRGKKKKNKDRDTEFERALAGVSGIWADRDPKEFEATRSGFSREFSGQND